MTTDVPVQFLKLPEPKDEGEDKNKNIPLMYYREGQLKG